MNNKGFAITGILYTLFVLFIMILLSILGAMSYRKGILEKTVLSLEDKFKLVKVEADLSTTYAVDGTTRKATKDGKYEFVINSIINDQPHTVTCSVYLEKGDIIPMEIDGDNVDPDFTLIPNDCNRTYQVVLENSTDENKLILSNVYEFEG